MRRVAQKGPRYRELKRTDFCVPEDQRVTSSKPPLFPTSARTASRNSGWTSGGYKRHHWCLDSTQRFLKRMGILGPHKILYTHSASDFFRKHFVKRGFV